MIIEYYYETEDEFGEFEINDDKEIAKAIAVGYTDDKQKQEIIAKFIYDYDLVDELAESCIEDVKDYFEDEAREEWDESVQWSKMSDFERYGLSQKDFI